MSKKVYEIEFRTTVADAGAAQVQQDLRDVSQAVDDVKAKAAQPIAGDPLADLTKGFEEGKTKIDDLKKSLEEISGAPVDVESLKGLQQVIGGIAQASSGGAAGQVSGMGRAIGGFARIAGMSAPQVALLTAAAAGLISALPALYKAITDNAGSAEEQLKNLSGAASKAREDLEKTTDVKMDAASVLERLGKLRDAYAEMAEQAAAAQRAQENLAQSEANLEAARLNKEKAAALQSARPEDRPVVEALFNLEQINLQNVEKIEARQREIENQLAAIEKIEKERAGILANVAAAEKRLEDAKAAQAQAAEFALKNTSPTAYGIDPTAMVLAGVSRERSVAAKELLEIRKSVDKELYELQEQLKNLDTDLQARKNDLEAAITESQAIDISNIDKMKDAIVSLKDGIAAAQQAVQEAQQAGSNIDLQSALDRLTQLMEFDRKVREGMQSISQQSAATGAPAFEIFDPAALIQGIAEGAGQLSQVASDAGTEVKTSTDKFAWAMFNGAQIIRTSADAEAESLKQSADQVVATINEGVARWSGAIGDGGGRIGQSVEKLGSTITNGFESVTNRVEGIATTLSNRLSSLEARLRAAESEAREASDRSKKTAAQVAAQR